MFLVCFSWAGLGMVFAYSALLSPSLSSVEAGLGRNRVTHLWHRKRFRSCGLGFKWLLAYSVLFFSSSNRPPPPARELGVIWITLTIPTGAQDRLVFVITFHFSVVTFSPYPRCRWYGDGFRCRFIPAPNGWAFPSFSFSTYLAGCATLPFRGAGVGLEEPHLPLMFYCSLWNGDFHEFPKNLDMRLIRVG